VLVPRVARGASTERPDRAAYYQAMIEKFTTLDLTARQIHEIGLKEVEAEPAVAPLTHDPRCRELLPNYDR